MRRSFVALGAGAAALVLLIPGCVALVALAARPHVVPFAAAPAMPVGIVLGARATPAGEPLRPLAGRIALALALYRAGKARQLYLSGIDTARDPEVSTMRRLLAANGVPRTRLIDDPGGFDTRATCEDAARAGIRRALVISQRYHVPRAVFLCRNNGIDAVGVGGDDVHVFTPRDRVREYVREWFADVKAVVVSGGR